MIDRVITIPCRNCLGGTSDDARLDVLQMIGACSWCGRLMDIGLDGYPETCHCTNDE